MKHILILSFLISSFALAQSQSDPDHGQVGRPTVLQGALSDYFYPGLEDKIAQMWDFVKSNTGVNQIKSEIQPPIIYFAPFIFAKEDPSWLDWQKSWIKDHPEIWDDWRKQSGGRSPEEEGNPFPKQFAAFEYYGSPRIQVDPFSSFIPYYQYDEYGNRKDIAGLGYYAVGHELHHYALTLIGIPIRLHHCLFVRSRQSDEHTYMDNLANFLIQNKISSDLVKFRGSDAEALMDPCRYLTNDDLKQVDAWLMKL